MDAFKPRCGLACFTNVSNQRLSPVLSVDTSVRYRHIFSPVLSVDETVQDRYKCNPVPSADSPVREASRGGPALGASGSQPIQVADGFAPRVARKPYLRWQAPAAGCHRVADQALLASHGPLVPGQGQGLGPLHWYGLICIKIHLMP